MVEISRISIETQMSPNGNATHYIKAGLDPNPKQIVAQLSGYFKTCETVNAQRAPIQARYVRVDTTSSPSWVAWRHLSIS